MKFISASLVFLSCCCFLATTSLIVHNYSNKDAGLRAIIFRVPCLRWHHSGRCLWRGYYRFNRKSVDKKLKDEAGDREKPYLRFH